MIQKVLYRLIAAALSVEIVVLITLVVAKVKQDYHYQEYHRYYSVAEVWENAPTLVGKTIAVEGPVSFEIGQTAVLCRPAFCDCNETYGYVDLISDCSVRDNSGRSYRDEIGVQIDCVGNECHLTCTPFDPTYPERLLITGTLVSDERNGQIAHLYITDIDFSASRQWVNGEWQDINTGTYIIPRASIPPPPKPCQNMP
ncbi:MAG: hypothetical protein JW726_19900 [Anaerolineales bacterium]|nr:hypothetical protein [Anaerolineales bacterium]